MGFLAAILQLFIISLVFCAPSLITNDDNFKLIILHNNDMHARFEQTGILSDKCSKIDAAKNKCYGGFARVATKVKEYRVKAKAGEVPSVLYLNAGDTYTGTPWFALYKDEIAADFLNFLKPDAASLGNHEFDEGTKSLAQFLKKVKFPILAANVNFGNEAELQAISLNSSIIFDVGTRKIGVIGYLTPETKEVAIGNRVEFTDEIDELNTEATKLKAQGVNIIIALGHSGYEKDKQIAAHCPEIDLVIGSHSHTFLYTGKAPSVEVPEGDYPTTVTQASGKKVPVVQAYAFTKYLGYLHLEFNNRGDLVEIDGTPILLDSSVLQDPEVLQMLEKYRLGVLDYENQVGSTLVFLNGICRRSECNLGNFFTDAMVDWYRTVYNANGTLPDISIGLIAGGGIRASISHESTNGTITKEDASLVIPFRSRMRTVEVTGEALLEALEHSVQRYNDGEKRGEFLQMSGVKVVYDMNLSSGHRVIEAKVLCAGSSIPQWQNIVDTEKYRIVMQEFLADGGDGYNMFKGAVIEQTNTLDLDVFLHFLKKKSPVNPSVEGRITIIPFAELSEAEMRPTLISLN